MLTPDQEPLRFPTITPESQVGALTFALLLHTLYTKLGVSPSELVRRASAYNVRETEEIEATISKQCGECDQCRSTRSFLDYQNNHPHYSPQAKQRNSLLGEYAIATHQHVPTLK